MEESDPVLVTASLVYLLGIDTGTMVSDDGTSSRSVARARGGSKRRL